MSGWPSGLRREVQATKSQSKRQDVSSRKHASILMGSARVGSNPTPDIFFDLDGRLSCVTEQYNKGER